MFTGLIQKLGTFAGIRRTDGGAVIDLATDAWETPLEKGESVAVQGVCLTVTDIRSDGFSADVLDETLRVTALGTLRPGCRVNLERALRPTDRMGGHIVQGHVDGLAELLSVRPAGRDHCLRFACRAEEFRYIVHKGSVALDGTSLTVSAIPGEGEFEVCLIPTTWRETSLSERVPGDRVNLETDIVGRYVEKFLGKTASGGVTMEMLQNAGF